MNDINMKQYNSMSPVIPWCEARNAVHTKRMSPIARNHCASRYGMLLAMFQGMTGRETMTFTKKYIGESINAERIYRVYPEGSHLDIGDVIRRHSAAGRDGHWCAWPAVQGEARPRSACTHHRTLRDAVERLERHMHDADE